MKKRLILTTCAVLLLAAMTVAVLAVSYHRVVVVDGNGGTPIPGAFVYIPQSSGSPEEVGRTDASGRLVFWTAPLPVSRMICANAPFYAMNCVSGIGLLPVIIELPIPPSAP